MKDSLLMVTSTSTKTERSDLAVIAGNDVAIAVRLLFGSTIEATWRTDLVLRSFECR
jgi:hypothetical protein